MWRAPIGNGDGIDGLPICEEVSLPYQGQDMPDLSDELLISVGEWLPATFRIDTLENQVVLSNDKSRLAKIQAYLMNPGIFATTLIRHPKLNYAIVIKPSEDNSKLDIQLRVDSRNKFLKDRLKEDKIYDSAAITFQEVISIVKEHFGA